MYPTAQGFRGVIPDRSRSRQGYAASGSGAQKVHGDLIDAKWEGALSWR